MGGGGGISRDQVTRWQKEIPTILHRLAGDDLQAFLGFVPRVTVISTEHANAFALPSGAIAITSGLLRSITSADQLAFVLSHELGHLVLKHHSNGHAFATRADLSRDLMLREIDADQFAMKLTGSAGYDVQEGARLLEQLEDGTINRSSLHTRRELIERARH
jgi:Zn-dependent protease with chaperone function